MKNIEKLYTEDADLYHKVFYSFLRYDKAVGSFLKNFWVPGTQKLRVLDAGCGSGLLTKVLWREGVEFDAFDLTEAMLVGFRKWADEKNNVRILKADVLEPLPEDWNNYNNIVSSAMLEYVVKEKIVDVLRGLKARIAPEGKFLLFITKKNWLTNYFIGKLWGANTYGRKELVKVFEEAGFKNIKFIKFKFPYNYFNLGMYIIETSDK